MQKNLLAFLLSSALLTACSSGGGSSNNSSNPNNAPSTSNPSTNSYQVYSDKQDINHTERTIREALDPKLDKKEHFFSTGEDLGINKLYLDNKVVTLIPEGVKVGEFYFVNSNNYKNGSVISGEKFNPVRFGYIQNEMFAHGNASTDVPLTGEATYLGKVVALAVPTTSDGKINTSVDTNIVTGNSNIKVDFANKKVQANFTDFVTDKAGYKINDIQVKGSFKKVNIKPDRMSYVSIKSNDDFKQGQLQAHFYGTNAEAIAGTFHKQTNDNHYIEASFGAKKQ